MQKYVNMADIISEAVPGADRRSGKVERLAGTPDIALIELLFFAYRDFIADPDALLATYGFGRAHHRVLHFVSRHPGMRVADLLDILRITKQSLGRVLKQLVDNGFIEQRPGAQDRRQRLLFTTEIGSALASRLIEMQLKRVRAALAALPQEQRAGARAFLHGMVDAEERAKVDRLIDG